MSIPTPQHQPALCFYHHSASAVTSVEALTSCQPHKGKGIFSIKLRMLVSKKPQQIHPMQLPPSFRNRENPTSSLVMRGDPFLGTQKKQSSLRWGLNSLRARSTADLKARKVA